MRQKSQELEERYERARMSHRSVEASVLSANPNLTTEVDALRETVTHDTTEAERLRQEIDKLRLAQEKIQQEIKVMYLPTLSMW